MSNQLMRDNVGFVLLDEKQRQVARLNWTEKKISASIMFANLQIDFDQIIQNAIAKPINPTRLRQLCWDHILDMIEKVKGDYKYAAVFTRIEVGSGYNTLRYRMNMIVNFVFERWYSPAVRKDMENENNADFMYSRLTRRINRQNYYPENQN